MPINRISAEQLRHLAGLLRRPDVGVGSESDGDRPFLDEVKSGGIDVALSEVRMKKLRGRMSSAKAWGIPAEIVTPKQVVE